MENKLSKSFLLTLLKVRYFAPLFWVQFCGALNDNIFKNALVVLVIYRDLSAWGLPDAQIVNVAAGLFIAPFFLFSASAGQLADKFEKSCLIRWVKLLEVFIMITAAIGLWLQSLSMMLIALFLLGTQATLFGPLKYGILPQYLSQQELLSGNGLIEMGTFIAILIGTEWGAGIIALKHGDLYIIVSLLLVSLIGYAISWQLPLAAPANPTLKIDYNPLRQTWKNLQKVFRHTVLFPTIIAISWFWLYGAVILTQLPDYVKTELSANSSVLTLFFALFSVGIGVGSMLCPKFSRHVYDIRLVLIGAIGMTVFGVLLFFITPAVKPVTELLSLTQFFSHHYAWFITGCLFSLSVFAGFYTVPLYVLLQEKSALESRSQTIAANNIMNAFFMVIAAILTIVLLKLKFSITQLFLILSLSNSIIPFYFYQRVRKI